MEEALLARSCSIFHSTSVWPIGQVLIRIKKSADVTIITVNKWPVLDAVNFEATVTVMSASD